MIYIQQLILYIRWYIIGRLAAANLYFDVFIMFLDNAMLKYAYVEGDKKCDILVSETYLNNNYKLTLDVVIMLPLSEK